MIVIVRQAPRLIRLAFTVAVCYVVAHWAAQQFAQAFVTVFILYVLAHHRG